jgi:hypothetical protein
VSELAKGRRRCYAVYALAPDGVSAREANDLLNEYVADRRRGVLVFHDHFTGKPHGGLAVFDVRDGAAYELLDDAGPLEGWELRVHPFVYALAATGFAELVDFNLEHYAGTTLEELREAEEPDDRYWWRA